MSNGSLESFERRPASPRRVRNGIRLRGPEPSARSWVARQWITVLDQMIGQAQRRDGLEYARLGQTTELSVEAGSIDARVQGRASRPYRTRWHVPELGAAQWQQLIDAMAGEAFYAAKLLADEVPAALESLLDSIDLKLLPDPAQITVGCDCGAPGPCKHAAAVGYLMAQQLDDEPLAILRLRGMPGGQVVERLSAARARRARGVAAAHAEPVVGQTAQVQPLESCLESFWRPGPELDELKHMPPPHHASHALLRRLGPSPLPGRFPLVGLLASVYDTVSDAAIRLRDEAEGLDRD